MVSEIAGGLRNAIEKGTSLEQAVESFILAGYPEDEVRAAAAEISNGASNMIRPAPVVKPTIPVKPIAQNIPQSNANVSAGTSSVSNITTQKAPPVYQRGNLPMTPLQPLTNVAKPSMPVAQSKQNYFETEKPNQANPRKTLAIFLIFVLILLIAALGATIFFSEAIAKFIQQNALFG